jgi:hypothetical protein
MKNEPYCTTIDFFFRKLEITSGQHFANKIASDCAVRPNASTCENLLFFRFWEQKDVPQFVSNVLGNLLSNVNCICGF